MRNRPFSTFAIFLLLLTPTASRADIMVARDVESQRVHFDSSNFGLSPDSRLILDQTVSLLARMNEAYSIKIMGFTDSHGAEELNHDLSVKRANTVAAYLISQGIDRNRILIQGLGDESPVASNDTENGRLRNRRVEFKFITPDTSDLKLTASTGLVAVNESKEEILEIKPTGAVEQPAAQPVEQKPVVEVLSEPAKPAAKPTNEEPKSVDTPLVSRVPADRVNDTMLASEKKKKSAYVSTHNYEERKRAEAGQSYVQVTPLWMTVDGLQSLGAGKNRVTSQPSFRGEAGWVSFLDESLESFVTAKGYGSFLRFSDDAAASIATKQKEFTFGGEIGVGRYFHPNVFLQVSAGYGTELIYRSSGGNIEMDHEYIGHAGLSVEGIVWRFSQLGNIGLDGSFMYYDIGSGVLDSGTSYGLSVFVDYDFLRAGLGFNMLSLETTNVDFSAWSIGPNLRLYF